jgi:hypothetical protein
VDGKASTYEMPPIGNIDGEEWCFPVTIMINGKICVCGQVLIDCGLVGFREGWNPDHLLEWIAVNNPRCNVPVSMVRFHGAFPSNLQKIMNAGNAFKIWRWCIKLTIPDLAVPIEVPLPAKPDGVAKRKHPAAKNGFSAWDLSVLGPHDEGLWAYLKRMVTVYFTFSPFLW